MFEIFIEKKFIIKKIVSHITNLASYVSIHVGVVSLVKPKVHNRILLYEEKAKQSVKLGS
jgi:hypothetical protein